MDHLEYDTLLYAEGRLSLSKAAMLCCMVDNDLDEQLVNWLAQHEIRAVITRVGGTGSNLKHKLLRNAFGAAENSGLLAVSPRNRYAVTRLVEDIMRSIDTPLLDIAGGGLKIALAVYNSDLAMGVHGKLGIPGMDVDYEISVARTLNNYLEG